MTPSHLLSEVLFALRGLRTQPTYAAAVVVTMAIGIGATATTISAIDAVLFRELPYEESDRLVQVFSRFRPRPNMDTMPVAPANFEDWRAAQTSFVDIAAFRLSTVNVIGRDLPERLRTAQVTPNLFAILGVRPAAGRTLTRDDHAQAAPAAVISDLLWQRRFGRDPAALGADLITSSGTYSIVGIMPPAFRFPIGWMGATNVDVWTPLHLTATERVDRRGTTLNVVARLAPGTSVASAQTAMDDIAGRLERDHPDTNRDWATTVMPLADRGIANVRPLLRLLAAAVTGLLLIACVNVANLLLARGLDRQRELTVRAALGASRGRIVQQLLVEGLVISILGGGFGLLLATWGSSALAAIAPVTMVPELGEMRVNSTVIAVTLGVAVLTGVLFSIVPAWLGSQLALTDALRGRHGDTRQRHKLKQALVAGEVALTIVLLAPALAVTRTFTRSMALDLGFDPARAALMRTTLPIEKYPAPETWTAFFDTLQARALRVTGVVGAALSTSAPMENTSIVTRYRVVGTPPPDAGASGPLGSNLIHISPTYFEVAGIPVRQGRRFGAGDGRGAHVAIVNEAFVRRTGGQAAIGSVIVLQGDLNRTAARADSSAPLTIVGIVGDVKDYGRHLMTPPAIYLPLAQDPQRTVSLIVRAAEGGSVNVADVRAALGDVDPNLAPTSLRSLDEMVSTAHSFFAFTTVLVTMFAAIAIALALAGLFGVVAYATARRGHEMAVRQALGATARSIVVNVVGRALAVTMAGCVAGLVLVPAALQFLTRTWKASLNVDVVASPIAAMAQCLLLMTAVGVLAASWPAWRAARANPLTALRRE